MEASDEKKDGMVKRRRTQTSGGNPHVSLAKMFGKWLFTNGTEDELVKATEDSSHQRDRARFMLLAHHFARFCATSQAELIEKEPVSEMFGPVNLKFASQIALRIGGHDYQMRIHMAAREPDSGQLKIGLAICQWMGNSGWSGRQFAAVLDLNREVSFQSLPIPRRIEKRIEDAIAEVQRTWYLQIARESKAAAAFSTLPMPTPTPRP